MQTHSCGSQACLAWHEHFCCRPNTHRAAAIRFPRIWRGPTATGVTRVAWVRAHRAIKSFIPSRSLARPALAANTQPFPDRQAAAVGEHSLSPYGIVALHKQTEMILTRALRRVCGSGCTAHATPPSKRALASPDGVGAWHEDLRWQHAAELRRVGTGQWPKDGMVRGIRGDRVMWLAMRFSLGRARTDASTYLSESHDNATPNMSAFPFPLFWKPSASRGT